ncbi:MAG: right-handed parallel beta-helix repeat-containing protein [Ruminococcus sp.]
MRLYLSSKIKNNIEVDLQGHTIDGNADTFFCKVYDRTCSLKITSSNDKGCIKNSKFHAVRFQEGELTIENCIFENYSAGAVSAGCYSNTNIRNCLFRNKSGYSGGAIELMYNFKISDCIFENNKAKCSGGTFYAISNSDSVIENCTFNNNTAEEEGGVIRIGSSEMDSYAAGRIKNCTFNGNYTKKDLGGVYPGQLSSTNHYFRNVTIENNKCGKEGGGAYANASGFNTADIRLFGWNKIRYNTNIYGSSSNAMMIKSAARTVFKIMDDFDPYNSDIRGTTNSDGSCMVFLNTSSKYVYRYSYGMQSGAFRADYGKLEQSGSCVYWSK